MRAQDVMSWDVIAIDDFLASHPTLESRTVLLGATETNNHAHYIMYLKNTHKSTRNVE